LKTETGIPAIVLTGQDVQTGRPKVLRSGYQVHLPKPIEPEELLVVIADLVNRNSFK
jgi:CheY-like chemotaxis protein